jgi:hypothetical protein
MDTPKSAPTPLSITLDWVHIRQADRSAGHGKRSLSSFTLALVEHSRYPTGRLTEDAVTLTDFNGRLVRCAAT